MCIDTIEEHYKNSKSEPKYAHNLVHQEKIVSNDDCSACHIDSLSLDTEMSFAVDPPSTESIDPDIEMAFEANTHSVENIEGNDLEIPDAETCLFCVNGSNSFDESLIHMKANHNFNIPNKRHLNIEPVNLVECFRHLRLKDDSTTEGLGLDDFAGLPSAAFKTPNVRAPGTSFVHGTSEARRVYLRALRMYKEKHHSVKNPGMRVIQDDIGSEVLFNTLLEMSEKERWGLDNDTGMCIGERGLRS
ncbi:hypothetical protein FSST1_005321 [Fusarium sambucinum]